MKTNLPRLLLAAILTSFVITQPTTGFAQTSAFSYQGKLTDGTTAANGQYDFRFRVFDIAERGRSIAGPVTNTAVTVSNGLFTTSVDLGPVFDSQPRWLEVAVRLYQSGTAFTVLAPRQELTATPKALFALTADTATGVPSGTITSAMLANGAVITAGLADNAVVATKLGTDPTSLAKVTGGAMSTSDGNLVLATRTHLNDQDLHFRSDLNHGLGWYGAGKLFGGDNVNGPALYGNSGGVLGVRSSGTDTTALSWDSTGVSIAGQVRIGGGNPGAGKILVSDANGQASWQPPGNYDAVPSGGMILSSNASDVNLQNAGYVKLGRVEMADSWERRTPASSLAGRSRHSAVWTGSEMIVWGGYYYDSTSHYPNDGGRYRPASNSWTAITTTGAPAGRTEHTEVWTGTDMIIWGGWDGTNNFNSGGRFNPTSGTWNPVSTGGAPSARRLHSAVWTGTEMIVWGGTDGTTNYLNNGGRYNPTVNTWTTMTTSSTPVGRIRHTAVWTGHEMIVWGGIVYGTGFSDALNNGGRYNPAANTWTAVTTSGAPLGRYDHTAVWSGSEMIVWAGQGKDGSYWGPMNYGGRYNPTANSWAGMTTDGAPSSRTEHTAVWTGSEMIVWGGDGLVECNDGGLYQPAANSWRPLATFGAPAKRALHTAVWTGGEMIIWGGSGYYNDTLSYTPPRILHLYQKP